MGFDTKELNQIGRIILAGMFACVACVALWAGLIVLLVLIITSPGNYLAEGVLLGWVALMVVFALLEIGESSLGRWAGTGWQPRIFLTPALPLIIAGIYVWRLTAPFRQSRADRRRRRR